MYVCICMHMSCMYECTRACFMSPPFFWMFHRHRSAVSTCYSSAANSCLISSATTSSCLVLLFYVSPIFWMFRVYFCVVRFYMYTGLTTTHTTIPLVYPSRVTRHASLRSHRHMFIFHHPLPLGLVSLSPRHYHKNNKKRSV